MIDRIEDTNELMSYNKRDIFRYRIMSLMKAYGTKYDFALFYRQVIDGNITAIISKLDGDFTLSYTDNADTDELEQFFTVIGFSSLLCDDGFSMENRYTQGAVMKTEKKVELHKSYVTIDRYPKLMELFNLLDYDSADFEAWYVDISHRIRHGCAMAYSLNMDSQIISSAVLSSIYEDGAILSAVQTLSDYRRMGYGGTLVSEIICDFPSTVYLMRAEGANEEFYSKLGFVNCGKWRLYK